ncbi:MAG: response regulator [Thermodesulfobacteriota bacterium]
MNTTPAPKTRGNLLIVDDTPENLTVLRQMLTEKGFRVRPALSGEIALQAVRTELPDLILLDIMMPGMDGYGVCGVLKAVAKTRDIPVLFISALDDKSDKVKAFQAGGVDYIIKPFQSEEVLARVETHLKLRRLQQAVEEKNRRLEATVADLEKALDEIKTLKGLIPICSNCKKIRDDKGFWNHFETYISEHTEAAFSHGICPECVAKLYPGLIR